MNNLAVPSAAQNSHAPHCQTNDPQRSLFQQQMNWIALATTQRLALLDQTRKLQQATQLEPQSYYGAKLIFRLNPSTCKVGQIVGYRNYYSLSNMSCFHGVLAKDIKSWGTIIHIDTLTNGRKINTVATVKWDGGIFTGQTEIENLYLL